MSFAVVKPYCHINERGETVSYTHNEMVGLARMAIADVGYSPRDTGEIYAIKSLRQMFPRLSMTELSSLVWQALQP